MRQSVNCSHLDRTPLGNVYFIVDNFSIITDQPYGIREAMTLGEDEAVVTLYLNTNDNLSKYNTPQQLNPLILKYPPVNYNLPHTQTPWRKGW